MSVGKELWDLVRGALKAENAVMALVTDVFDKVPSDPWKTKNAYISRGPVTGLPDDSECISGQEITMQIDVWSRKPDRWTVDDIISAMRRVLHENEDLELPHYGLVEMRVTLTRVIDDPDPNTVHGLIQVTALIEEPERI